MSKHVSTERLRKRRGKRHQYKHCPYCDSEIRAVNFKHHVREVHTEHRRQALGL